VQISNEDYQQFKPLLLSIGYRMLGSIVEAEDIVQETFLRAYQINEQKMVNKKAYLCKMVTNRCLDVLKSARHRREQYVGPWNPEPLLLEKTDYSDPSEILLQKEGLSIAIANIIEKKEDNCRKIFSRAKQKISRVEGENSKNTLLNNCSKKKATNSTKRRSLIHL
jgi:RNA polymerase sigma-70 factor (ECF subfamily)